ncbi:UDP-3-O-[3-hydroxymyristoyl] glucosamine N-acyltransferase [Pseudomonas syringae pv. actinidiae]|uniref:UDP-3-O-[3-hydroxymyristoyl] glucosamine N-acyltransferase n=1 Tax=Pseudomonas syringae pv. actinidiae TaxID=103796 RepID=A0A2V0QLZ6_PSESF|nr:UDP-3-O-[3-hydroxymyristoyl] glucosamine N-acyltransferase [Pseudomonas syringae pv. actinidiae]
MLVQREGRPDRTFLASFIELGRQIRLGENRTAAQHGCSSGDQSNFFQRKHVGLPFEVRFRLRMDGFSDINTD